MDYEAIAQRYGAKPTSVELEELAKKYGAKSTTPEYDPSEGMSALEKGVAGFSKAYQDALLAAKQNVRLASTQDVEEMRRRDEPLMRHGSAKIGNLLGNAIMLAPTAVIPGAASVLGGAALGGMTGLLEPRGEKDNWAANVMTGGMFGAALPLAATAVRAGKSALEPFFQKGRERIVGRAFERFGGDETAAKIANSAGELVQGSKPTLAEATQDAGLATLQRSAAATDPLLAKAMAERELQNNAARVQALRSLGGEPGELAFHKAARETTADELYKRAFAEVASDSPWIKGELTQLMKRPAFVEALKDAQTLAANEGYRISKNGAFRKEDATLVLHYAKKALDDQIKVAGPQAQKGLIATRNKVVSLIESKDFSPSYREARDTFHRMSEPVNRMEVGQELAKRARVGENEMLDALGNPTLTPSRMSQAIRSGEDVVKAATKRSQPLEAVLTGEQMQLLKSLQDDLSRLNVARTAGKPVGSPTAQFLSSQNLLEQIAGPLGMPKSWSQSALLETALRPLDFAYKRAEPRVQEALAKALLDPEEAKRIMVLLQAQQAGLLGRLSQGGPFIAPPLSGLLAMQGPALLSATANSPE